MHVWLCGAKVAGRTGDQNVPGSTRARYTARSLPWASCSHTHVSLSPSSITWYRSSGGDALWLGR